MDGARFDDLTRALARPTSRRTAVAALAALLPAAAVAVASPAGAKRRRGCRPRCGDGFVCENRECVCPSGVTCAGACCAAGKACEGGACVTPEPPPACIGAGEPCKGLGRACCDGRTCASGQGGKTDVACYLPAGASCVTTAECVYGAACRDGSCADIFVRCTVCPENCPHTTIEGALADPRYPVVTVAAGVYRPVPADVEEGLESGLVIRRSVVIEACGDGPVTIDGGGTHRVVRITEGESGAPTVTLRNLVIANGAALNGGGGGICLEGGSLVLDGATVRDNHGGDGGGIHASSLTTLEIAGASRIAGNVASGNGGGVYKYRDAILTIRDRAAITGNTAEISGGGVYSDDCETPIPAECAGQASVCGNTAVSGPQCQGEFGPSCTRICCAIKGQFRGRGDVGAALC